MGRLEDALREHELACEAEDNWVPADGPFREVMLRRDAATLKLHAIQSPWHDCLCPLCSGRD